MADKTQNNPLRLSNGNAALAAAFTLSTGQCRGMSVPTNQFCAGGATIAGGAWASVGGNPDQNGQGQGNGMRATRQLTPCTDGSCQWAENSNGLQVTRWVRRAGGGLI